MQCLVRIQTLKLFTSRMKQSNKRKGIFFPVVVDVVGCLFYFIEWLGDFNIWKNKRYNLMENGTSAQALLIWAHSMATMKIEWSFIFH